MRNISYLQATVAAQREEMARDEKVFLMGLDVSWDIMGTATGLLEEFGPERVRDAPISENGYVGTAIGASMVGMRPIAEIEIAPSCTWRWTRSCPSARSRSTSTVARQSCR